MSSVSLDAAEPVSLRESSRGRYALYPAPASRGRCALYHSPPALIAPQSP
jgi:hypothetical protein